MKARAKKTAKPKVRQLEQRDLSPNLLERVERARRTLTLTAAAITPDDDPEVMEEVTIDPVTAKALIDTLQEAAMDLFLITRLDDSDVLNRVVPSDDELWTAEQAGIRVARPRTRP